MSEKKIPVLEIDGLSVRYKVFEGLLDVIPNLSLYAEKGERIGLIGETGCGKTTVLKAVASLLQNTPAIVKKSAIKLFGKPIEGANGKKLLRGVSMILQDPSTSLNPTLKVSEQMTDVLKNSYPHMKPSEYKARMLSAMEAVSMPAPERVLGSYPIQLSGGMRQRVCIATALLKEPELIMADEPTTALDVTIEEQILDLLNDLVTERGMTLILVSHALGAVRKMTDRLYVMYAGNIVEIGKTQEVFRSPMHPYSVGLIEATPKLTGAGLADGIAGDIPSYLNPPKGCRFASRCPRASEKCFEETPVLRVVGEAGERQVACHNV